jgi:hypothetical protein
VCYVRFLWFQIWKVQYFGMESHVHVCQSNYSVSSQKATIFSLYQNFCVFSSVQQDWSSLEYFKEHQQRNTYRKAMNKHWNIWLINNKLVPDLPRIDAVVFRLYTVHDCISAHLHTLWLICALLLMQGFEYYYTPSQQDIIRTCWY